MNKIKIAFLYLIVGISVPTIFLLNAFLIPEPYSRPLIYVALSPKYLMSFFLNRERLDSLSMLILGGIGQNDAEIAIVILTVFWFFASILGLFLLRFLSKSKNILP